MTGRRNPDQRMREIANASIRLTAAEWARVVAIDPKSGSYSLDFALALIGGKDDVRGPPITRDEYLAAIGEPAPTSVSTQSADAPAIRPESPVETRSTKT